MDDGWWNALKSNMSDVNVHFVPAFFMEPPIFPSLRSIDGAFSVSVSLRIGRTYFLWILVGFCMANV